ncbi:hypothetical protein BDZ97DRAFT_1920954 [Flammula alnicola]|nr:hypothetical protein BDZ97DRAFT_1920954 [Flammula alnicola]
MSSPYDSKKPLKIAGIGADLYRTPSGIWGNPLDNVTIASFSKGLWPGTNIILPLLVANAAPPDQPRREITFRYFAPLVDGVRRNDLAGTPNQRSKVERTIKEWERYAHVSFVGPGPEDAKIRISFDPAKGNHSAVGIEHEFMAGVDAATINLGGVLSEPEFATDYERHVILHEFGHALGLFHEHQSPAREGVITLEASCARYLQSGWSALMVESQISSQTPLHWISSYSELDLNSVMTYATSGQENILQELKHELSDMDKAYMVINYPRVGERRNPVYPRQGGELVEMDDTLWTMEYALTMAGLTTIGWPAERQQILERYAVLNEAHTNEIREIFGNWTKARRAAERTARGVAQEAAAPA